MRIRELKALAQDSIAFTMTDLDPLLSSLMMMIIVTGTIYWELSRHQGYYIFCIQTYFTQTSKELISTFYQWRHGRSGNLSKNVHVTQLVSDRVGFGLSSIALNTFLCVSELSLCFDEW